MQAMRAQQSHAADTHHLITFQLLQVLVTFFSKFFSHFPHGTCQLSISNAHLILDAVYHPLNTTCPRKATLRNMPHMKIAHAGQGFHLHCNLVPKDEHVHCHWQHSPKAQSRINDSGLQVELFLVHSPLLKESYSVYSSA